MNFQWKQQTLAFFLHRNDNVYFRCWGELNKLQLHDVARWWWAQKIYVHVHECIWKKRALIMPEVFSINNKLKCPTRTTIDWTEKTKQKYNNNNVYFMANTWLYCNLVKNLMDEQRNPVSSHLSHTTWHFRAFHSHENLVC